MKFLIRQICRLTHTHKDFSETYSRTAGKSEQLLGSPLTLPSTLQGSHCFYVCVLVRTHSYELRAALLQALFKWLWNCVARTDGLRDKAAREPDREQAVGGCHGKLGWLNLLVSKE